jgi:hypothetical protein
MIVSLLEHAPLVEDLTITEGCVFDYSTPRDMAQLCPQLTKLHLRDNANAFGLLASFAQHCRHLRHIVLSRPTQQVLESLVIFKDHRLESLEIILSYRFVKTHFKNPERFLSGLQNLTSLTVKTDDENFGQQNFMQVFLPTSTATPLPLLTSLTIKEVSFAGDNFMVPFIAAHPRLESIVLIECNIKKPTLYAMATHLPRLRYLKIDQDSIFHPCALVHLVQNCPALDKIYTRTPYSTIEKLHTFHQALRLGRAVASRIADDDDENSVFFLH